ANVVINGRKEESLIKVADEIQSGTGAEVLPIAGDVTNDVDVKHLVQQAKSRFGRIDIMVTNAGGPPAGFFDDFDAGDYRQALELNLISTINLCREAIPHMRAQRWGRIVAIT